MAVLLTHLPSDPWRGQPLQANGEYIRVSDGAELFVRHWLPIGETRQVILALHGLGQHSGYHHRFGAQLAETGRAYFALDLRGNGLTRTAHGDVPSIERLYMDVDEIVRILRRRYPKVPVYVLGHSMGGAMVATWAAGRQPEIDGLLILSPAMTAAVTPLPWLNYLKGPAAWLFFPHRPVLSIDETAYARGRLNAIINMPTEVEFIAKDSLHLQRMSMQFALAANRFRNKAIALASQIRVPTLTLVGKADPACVGAQQFHEALTVPDKTFILVPDVGHMVFQIKEMPRVIDEVLVWLQAH
jgi:alpha-beta hydrolase superfamily lysophospholipase